MRFVIYVTVLIALLPLVLRRPFFGLCVYYVVSLLQPKLLCWRPEFQDALLVGVPLVIGAIAFGVRRVQLVPDIDPAAGRLRRIITNVARSPLFEPSWMVLVFVVLTIYIALTRLIVPYPLVANAYQFKSLCKVLFVTVLLTGLVCDAKRYRIIFIVVALSTAFWAIKGGFKVILLGPHQVYGKSYDNNLFALTSVMVLPMVFYIGLTLKHARWRAVFLACSALTCLGIIGSRSRAGFVAFGVVLLFMAWSSRYRLRAVGAVCLVAAITLTLSGGEIIERVESIATYRTDKSAVSRFYTWEVARTLFASNPLIGVGFANFEVAKDHFFGGRKAAHNIYLANLSELGLLGHPLWLIIIFGTIFTAYRLMRRASRWPEDLRWVYYCARGIMLGMIAFCIHGMFHNEEYLELMFTLVGLNLALHAVARRELAHHQLLERVEHDRSRAVDAGDRSPDKSGPDRYREILLDRPMTLSQLVRRH